MNIISMDTCFGYFSVSLMRSNEIIAAFQDFQNSKQAERLILSLEKILTDVNLSYDDFDNVAVSVGPGSFTGVRIGLAAAKMMNLVKKFRIIPISTLEILAFYYFQENPEISKVTCLINAKRGQFYVQKFENLQTFLGKSEVRIVNYDDLVIDESENVALLSSDSMDEFLEKLPPNLHVFSNIHAKDLALFALKYHQNTNFNENSIKPNYVREADAKVSSKNIL